jgi:hemoglobin
MMEGTTMRILALALILALAPGLGTMLGAMAQTAGPPMGATSDHQATLAAFGGPEGLARVADRGIDRVLADTRIAARFQGANIPRLKQQLGVQFCALLGGPCQYTGQDMAAAHAGMHLRLAEFNALAEDFQVAMDELDIPYRYQTRLIALLAPMQRDITEK